MSFMWKWLLGTLKIDDLLSPEALYRAKRATEEGAFLAAFGRAVVDRGLTIRDAVHDAQVGVWRYTIADRRLSVNFTVDAYDYGHDPATATTYPQLMAEQVASLLESRIAV